MSNFKELVNRGTVQPCPRNDVLALTDTLNVISGKWKLPIIAALLRGVNRFKDLLERLEKITPRMLSKELKELEMNGVVVRTVSSRAPILTEYTLTPSGKDFVNVIDTMIDWGMLHRAQVIR